MYEMFCDYAGTGPAPTPDDIQWGGLGNTGGYGVDNDDEYVYVVYNTAPFFSAVRKKDWTLVEDTPSLSGGGRGVHVDDSYVYTAHVGGARFTAIRIMDWSIVEDTPALSSTGVGVHGDAERIYLAQSGRPYLRVVQKSDWSIVAGTPDPRSSNGQSIHSDDEYVYSGMFSSVTSRPIFAMYRKSDWVRVRVMNNYARMMGIYVDEEYVYLAITGLVGDRPLHVRRKRDWSMAWRSNSNPTYLSVHADNDNLYLGHSGGIRIHDKGGWGLIHTAAAGAVRGISTDDKYVYIAGSSNNRPLIVLSKDVIRPS